MTYKLVLSLAVGTIVLNVTPAGASEAAGDQAASTTTASRLARSARSGCAAAGAAATGAPAPCSTRLAEDFVPLTRTERAARYERALFGRRAIFLVLASAGIDQGLQHPDGWEQDGRGFALRTISSYGQHAINATFEHGIALGLGEDNRYFASGRGRIRGRLVYAIESSFLARHDNGTRSVSVSALAGPAAGAFISRLWMPDGDRGVGNALTSWAITEGVRAGFNVTREFAPRFLRRILP